MLIDKMKTEITRFTWEATKDFGVASTSHVVNMPIWGSDYISGMYGRIKTAFSGMDGQLLMRIGTSDDDSCIMSDRDLGQTGELWIHFLPHNWFCKIGDRDCLYDSEAPIITFTSDDGNLEDLTAGEVELVVVHIVPDK